jgi:hypothetical protein
MAKRDRRSDRRVIDRRLKEGRGQGRGAEYKPYLRVQDVPSQGLATRVGGWKTGREHHFMTHGNEVNILGHGFRRVFISAVCRELVNASPERSYRSNRR